MDLPWRMGFICSDGSAEWQGPFNIEFAAASPDAARRHAGEEFLRRRAHMPSITRVILTQPAAGSWRGAPDGGNVAWSFMPDRGHPLFGKDYGFRAAA